MLSAPNRVVAPEKRGMSMIFQSYAIWPNMTVAQNVAFGLKLRKLPASELRARLDRILDVVQLGHLKDRYPAELSGGQQQRVALARAIVIEPEVLLLDEPLSNLDANLREEMRSEIRRLHDAFRITTVYVTHDQAEAMVTSDRIVVMNHGRIEQVDDPVSLYNRPRTRFVAGFIGRTNFLDGTVDGGDDRLSRLHRARRSGAGCRLQRAGQLFGPATEHRHASRRAGRMRTAPGGLQGSIAERAYLGEYWEYVVRPAESDLRLRVSTSPQTVLRDRRCGVAGDRSAAYRAGAEHGSRRADHGNRQDSGGHDAVSCLHIIRVLVDRCRRRRPFDRALSATRRRAGRGDRSARPRRRRLVRQCRHAQPRYRNADRACPACCARCRAGCAIRSVRWRCDPSYFPRALPWLLQWIEGRPAATACWRSPMRCARCTATRWTCWHELLGDDAVPRPDPPLRPGAGLGRRRPQPHRGDRAADPRPPRHQAAQTLNADDLRQMFPGIARDVTRGLLVPGNGYTVSPQRIVHTLAELFRCGGRRDHHRTGDEADPARGRRLHGDDQHRQPHRRARRGRRRRLVGAVARSARHPRAAGDRARLPRHAVLPERHAGRCRSATRHAPSS